MEPADGVAQALPAPALDTSGLDLLAEVMEDDNRSSSLSDIGDRLEAEDIDFSPHKVASEVDSEAETERIEDSPRRVRNKASIVLSVAGYGTSPSKLAQSTTYDDLEDGDDDNEIEESPSKASRLPKSNGIERADDSNEEGEEEDDDDDRDEDGDGDGDDDEEEEEERLPSPQEVIGKKRKRVASIGDISELHNADEPSRKRRGSVPVSLTSPLSSIDLQPRDAVTEPTPKMGEALNDGTPVPEEAHVIETRAAKGKRGKKGPGKRKGKRTRDADDDVEEHGNPHENGVGDEVLEDEENAEAADEGDEAEVVSKQEEAMRKTNALDTLVSIEHQFATLRDRVYEERIVKLNEELTQLQGTTPTHPEYLRQVETTTQYRDDKINHENKLFDFKLRALMTKSTAEYAQVNSTFFQRRRDLRESYLERLAQHNCQIQQDRFQTADASPEYSIPFPTQRSTQVSQQAAYNQEVSVLSGFAKYVGFPSSPAVPGLSRQQLDEDLSKMGIRLAPQLGAGSADNPHG